MALVGSILEWALQLYLLALVIRAVLSWVPMMAPQWSPHGVLLVGCEFIYTITDPPVKFFHRYIPNLRFGGIGLDLGFLVLMLVILVLERVVAAIFF
jgi:YggT family protein